MSHTILLLPVIMISSNINYQITTQIWSRMPIRHKVINFTMSHVKLLNYYAEHAKLGSRRLF
uniref:Putative ovule protein n=1 Tax=Solanum chacoense TaxID=4108 RepID=A0A0V0HH48_SOLCH